MRALKLSTLCLLLASCAMDERDDSSSPVAERQDALGTPPTSLAGYRWGTPLFPSNVRSAFVVMTPHPTDSSRFVAWGVDEISGRTWFFVHGDKRTDASRVISQVEADISIPVQLDINFMHAIAGQLNKGPGPGGPPPPPGGVPDWTAWDAYGHNISHKVYLTMLETF
ncbi:MAG: hypothetical protein QM817_21415 [Archangium sp.]